MDSFQIEEKNAFSRQSRVHWDCLPTVDAVVKWDDDGRMRLHQPSLKEV
jgi:hypothetical protein